MKQGNDIGSMFRLVKIGFYELLKKMGQKKPNKNKCMEWECPKGLYVTDPLKDLTVLTEDNIDKYLDDIYRRKNETR